jgi:outer membrane protein assembly factor BamB
MNSHPVLPCSMLAVGMLLLGSLDGAAAEDWPQWRGPMQNGTSRETGLPTAWSESAGIAWKQPLPQWGNSTPVIWGPSIFLTSHTDDHRLLVLKLDKATGRILWEKQAGEGTVERKPKPKKDGPDRGHQKFHATHNLATPSPTTDGEVVIVHFGNGDLAAYDFDGKKLWGRNLQDEFGPYTIWWGHANSPVLVGDLVISVCMQDSCTDLPDGKPAASYVVAHDKRTGKLKWKTPRPTEAKAESCDSYTTPLVWHHGPETELIVMGGQILDGYDPTNGRRVWSLSDLTGSRVITGPVISEDVVYATQGMRKPLLAVKLGGRGERPSSDVLWQYGGGTPDSPTPVVSAGLLFLVTDNGAAKCLDAATGDVKWEQRLAGEYRASPLVADGRIYFLNMKGLATVVAASAEFKKLAENQLDDETIASPAVSQGKLFLRGRKSLYAIGK